MKAVAAGDEIAIEAPLLTTHGVAHRWTIGRDAHRLHVLGLGDERRAAAIGGGEEILLQVRLAVGDELLSEVAIDIDQELASTPHDPDAVVPMAFALEAVGETILAQHVDGPGLEHPGADAPKH